MEPNPGHVYVSVNGKFVLTFLFYFIFFKCHGMTVRFQRRAL